jgi:hypothetical protein
VGKYRRGGEAKVVFMRKKAGKLLREEGSDCIFEADSPGANPSSRRPTDANEDMLIPQNC